MYLAEVERPTCSDPGTSALDATLDKWEVFPPSLIDDHGHRCCNIAKRWFFAMDRSQRSGEDLLLGPRWIRARYSWGPTRWPLHWCEAMDKRSLDCGALAALALAAYQERGVRSYTAQLVQRYSKHDTQNWLRNWEGGNASVSWINDDLVYHEACAVVSTPHEIRLWDPTAGWWVNPKQFAGYGAVLAVRLVVPDATHAAYFSWGDHHLPLNRWHQVQPAQIHFAT